MIDKTHFFLILYYINNILIKLINILNIYNIYENKIKRIGYILYIDDIITFFLFKYPLKKKKFIHMYDPCLSLFRMHNVLNK